MADRELIWSNFIQLSYNSYAEDADAGGWVWNHPELSHRPHLRWDAALWDDLVRQMVDAGVNQVVMSLGDGIRYDSHPEIAVDGAWTPAEMRAEKRRLAELGITLVPKLNFSTSHDLWLGDYHRMVSTPTYYAVCADLIAEVMDIFEGPELFHLGYDEETWLNQRHYDYVVIRQFDLWWRDFLWFVEQVTSRGARPWIWADRIWDHTREYLERMPTSVLQSNWYYDDMFDHERDRVEAAAKGIDLTVPPTERDRTTPLHAYLDLRDGGFEQVLAGSNHDDPDNFPNTVRWAQQALPRESVLGFQQTTWRPVMPEYRAELEEAIAKLAEGRAAYDPANWASDKS